MFSIEDHGSIVLVRPHTPDVEAWLEEHTEGEWFGRALVVEHRFVAPLVGALIEEGFACQ